MRGYEMAYMDRAPWRHRLIVRLFRRHILRVTTWIIGQGYSRGMIDSRRMHDLLGIQNRVLFPERERAPGGDDASRETK